MSLEPSGMRDQLPLRDVRCPDRKCKRLLFRAAWFGGIVEIVCPRCGALVRFPALLPEIIAVEDPASIENPAP